MTSKKRRPSGESGDPRKRTPREEADTDVVAAIAKLVAHTGARDFQVRYSDDEQPVIWMAVATYSGSRADAAAAMTPGQAAWRLGEQLVDGGYCTLCGRPTALVQGEDDLVGPEFAGSPLPTFCEYRYRAGKIVRGCDSLPVGTPR